LEIKDIFLKLTEVDAPFGYEEPMMRHMLSELTPLCDEVHLTPRGNVVGVQRGTDDNAPTVAIEAHMDQVGFVVANIDDRGFIRFRKVGGALERTLMGQHVRARTEKGPVKGVVGLKPGHITTPEEARTVPPLMSMYIDVGARSAEEVRGMGIDVGTPMVWAAPPVELANGLIASPGVDDKAGLASVIAVAKLLKDVEIPATVYYLAAVEEEGGLRGALSILYDLDVDMAVAIDTTSAGYQPEVNMRDLYYEVGKGPAIHYGEQGRGRVSVVHHHRVRGWLKATADAEGIPYQENFQFGGTDAGAMAKTRAGIPTATIALPRRYSHSPVEAFYISDLEDLVRVLVAAIKGLEPGFDLSRA
jgi:putative aminopeptidase FrvX